MALAKLILEWQRKSEFRSDSDFMFGSPFMASKKPYSCSIITCALLLSERGGGRSVGILCTTLTAWGTTASGTDAARHHANDARYVWRGMMKSMLEAHGRVAKQAIAP